MCTITTNLNEVKANSFAEKLMETINGGALTLMLSIGHRTGLFDVLSNLGTTTSQELAREAGLNERYVREWLGAMVTGNIVEIYPDGPKYFLPAEHAAFLTRAAGADNLGIFAQYITVPANVEDEIINCFKNGGGGPYGG
jgi:hypothetical protein